MSFFQQGGGGPGNQNGGQGLQGLMQLLGGQQQQQGQSQQQNMQNLAPLLQLLGQGNSAGGRGNPLIANALQQQGGQQQGGQQRPPIQVPPQMNQQAILPQGFNNIGQLLSQRLGGAPPQVQTPQITPQQPPFNPRQGGGGGNQTIQPFLGGGIGQLF